MIDPFYGITAACTASHWYTVGLGTSSNGQTLVFQQAQAPSIVHRIQQSADGAKREEIIAIVAGIALLILGILTDGAAFVASGLIVGLALGANQIAPGSSNIFYNWEGILISLEVRAPMATGGPTSSPGRCRNQTEPASCEAATSP